MPQGYGITLNDLPDGMADRFEGMIARRKSVSTGGKAALTGENGVSVVGVNHLMRDKNRFARS